jgi:acyl-CoA thioesterase
VGGPHKQVWLRTKMQPPQQPCLQTVQLNMGRDCYRPCH